MSQTGLIQQSIHIYLLTQSFPQIQTTLWGNCFICRNSRYPGCSISTWGHLSDRSKKRNSSKRLLNLASDQGNKNLTFSFSSDWEKRLFENTKYGQDYEGKQYSHKLVMRVMNL